MKVLLIDDHPLILSALTSVITALSDDVEVAGVGSAREAREALQAAKADFDLVLLDLQLGDADGFELLAELRNAYPALPVVVVSASDRAADVIRSIDLGAMGFVPKRSSHDMLTQALRLVMSGGIYVPPMALGTDIAAARPDYAETVPAVMQVTGPGGPPHQTVPTFESLGITPRQADVLAHLLQGKPNKLIAREMNLSVETVKDHVAAVLRALGVTSRTQAVLAVAQMSARGSGSEAFATWKPSQR
jgi:DNA-binding NarL/FixJ family response regulator